jgi:hypothetical protein
MAGEEGEVANIAAEAEISVCRAITALADVSKLTGMIPFLSG